MNSSHSIAAHYDGAFEVDAIEAWAKKTYHQFPGEEISLGLVFITPQFFDHASDILEILRVHARISLLVGCSSRSLIVNAQELDDSSGLVVSLHHLPNTQLSAFHFTQEQVGQGDEVDFWRKQTGIEHCNGWLVFSDPFHIDGEHWLHQWNNNWPKSPVLGGLAVGAKNDQRTQVY